MSMWQRILRDRHLVQAGTLCERYGRFWIGAALAIKMNEARRRGFPSSFSCVAVFVPKHGSFFRAIWLVVEMEVKD